MRFKKNKLSIFFIVGDTFHLTLAFLLSYHISFFTFDFTDNYLFLIIITNLIWLFNGMIFKIFDYERASRIEFQIINIFKVLLLTILIESTILFSIKSNTFSSELLINAYTLTFLLLLFWRVFSAFLLKKYRRLGFNFNKVVIIGSVNNSKQLIQFLSNPKHGYKLLALFYNNYEKQKTSCPSYPIEKLEEFCYQYSVEEIFFTESIYDESYLSRIIKFCDYNMIRLKISPDFQAFKQRKLIIDFYGALPVIILRNEPLQDEFNRLIKRIFDIIFSSIAIILVLSWLLPLLSILIKISSKGPVFFVQSRSGLDNIEFKCYKFRTMVVNSLSDQEQATKNDIRITKIGRFLRKTSLDELPQFFNVFIGNMSVVGPRPHMLVHTKSYSEIIDNYMVRQLVLPGITGAAQANGFRGETKNIKDMQDRVKYDVWYIENWSLLLDIKLILITFVNLFKGQDKAA